MLAGAADVTLLANRFPIHMSVLSPELQLLIQLCAFSQDTLHNTTNTNKASPSLDWDRVFDLANRHLVFLRLCEAVGTGSLPAPEPVLKALKQERKKRLLAAKFYREQLFEIFGALRSSGLPVVVLKGAALEAALYGGRPIRQYGDIDLYVPKWGISRAAHELEKLGYVTEVGGADISTSPVLSNMGEALFTKEGAGRIDVDLHWRLFSKDVPHISPLEGFITRTETTDLEGVSIEILSGSDLALYTFLHNSKHCYDDLGSICDAVAVLQRTSEADLNILANQAEGADWQVAFLLGFHLASAILRYPISQPLMPAVTQKRLRRLTEQCIRSFELPRMDGNDRERFLRALWPAKVTLRRRIVQSFAPQLADMRAMPLPRRAARLYYLIRPLRLAAKAARERARRFRDLMRTVYRSRHPEA